MKAGFEELRQAVLDKFKAKGDGYIPDLNDLSEDFEKNIKTLYTQVISGFISEEHISPYEYGLAIRNTFRSSVFKSVFEDLKVETISDTAIGTLFLIDDRTPLSFLRDKEKIKGKTIDFFVVFAGYKNWKSFVKNYPNPDITVPGEEKLHSAVQPQKTEKPKSQKLEIAGAKIIDEEFATQINTGKEFSKVEFYTAKQNEDCQWYGILNGYDIERNEYENIKTIVSGSFNTAKYYKVSAVIYGSGGSGKSTLLRRIAIDLSKEEFFRVVWINNNSFSEFTENGIKTIKENVNINFLVVMEDWYRIAEDNNNAVTLFLKSTDSISNIRLVIGDRTKEGKKYINHLNAQQAIFHLNPSENEHIIKEIVKNYPEWKIVSRQLFSDKKIYQSTLFLLLFIMARKDEKELKDIDLLEPETAFINVVKSDIKLIAKKYIGLAKALHYWSCVYSGKRRKFISYKSFLKIADHYNGNTEVSLYFNSLDLQSQVHDKLKIYINENEEGLLQFNHDILSDLGLSKISIEEWEPYGDIVKIQLLDTITDHGDDYSASEFLNGFMREKQNIFFQNKEKYFSYIDKLIDKGNKGSNRKNYINLLTGIGAMYQNIDVSPQDYEHFAQRFWDKNIYNRSFLRHYFEQINSINDIWSPRFLQIENLGKIEPSILKEVLNGSRNDTVKEDFIEKLLNREDVEKLDFELVCKCIEVSKNEKSISDFLNKDLTPEYRERIYKNITVSRVKE